MRARGLAPLVLTACAAAATPARPAPPPAPAPVASVTPAPPPPALPDGRHWVRRIDHHPGIGTGTQHDMASGTSISRVHLLCVPLDVVTWDERRRGYRLGESVDLWTSGGVMGGLDLERPMEQISLSGSCRCAFDPATVRRYDSEAACVRDLPILTRTCKGEACTYDGEPPLELGECEAAIVATERVADRIAATSEVELGRSLRRLAGATRLWVPVPELGCREATVRRSQGHTLIRLRYTLDDGLRVDTTWDTVLEPLRRKAQVSRHSDTTTADGARGGGTGDATIEGPLYLTAGAVWLLEEWFAFDRQACEAL